VSLSQRCRSSFVKLIDNLSVTSVLFISYSTTPTNLRLKPIIVYLFLEMKLVLKYNNLIKLFN
jgi:hypothetical protein